MKRILPLCVLWALPAFAADPSPGTVFLRDLNGDGKISPSEASASLVDGVMKQADTNGDGKISRAEAKALSPADTQNKERLKRILLDFDKMDANGDGGVSREELSDHVQKDPKVQRFLADPKSLRNPSMQGADATEVTPVVSYHFKL